MKLISKGGRGHSSDNRNEIDQIEARIIELRDSTVTFLSVHSFVYVCIGN